MSATSSESSPVGVPDAVLALQLDLAGAWSRVLARAGMPGVDGVAVGSFCHRAAEHMSGLHGELASGTYRPLPLRLALLGKKHGGVRCLLVPSVRDRVVQTALAGWLSSRWNTEFDAASYAYRPGLGVHDALRALVSLRDRGYHWMLDADIRSFFDSIPHGRLIESVTKALPGAKGLIGWIDQVVGGVVWDGQGLSKVAVGVPQGSPLSPILANFFLDGFDKHLRAEGFALVRYADDFLVLASSPIDLARARSIVEEQLSGLGLALNIEKTRMTMFGEPLRFLGADVRGDGVWLPLPVSRPKAPSVFVAAPMPRALLRAYATRAWPVTRQFSVADYREWARHEPRAADRLDRERGAKALDDTHGPSRLSALNILKRGRP